MAQFARPDADQATGLWGTTPLWSKIDDGAAEDNVVITSDNNTSPDNADVRLSDVTDPAVSTGHVIRARWNKSASGGHSINAVAELWQGVPGVGTLIATLSVTAIGSVEMTSTYTLSAGEADAITDYADLYLRLSRQGDTGGGPSGRRSLVVDFAEFETPDAPAGDRRGVLTWAELETPDAPRRGILTWAELETPDAPRRGILTWAELETPDAPRRGVLTWAELETPDAPRRGVLTWAELEAPEFDRRGVLTWAELETPDAPTNDRRGVLTWAELETPDAPRRGVLTWAELESPDAPRRGVLTWAELETPEESTTDRRGVLTWAELEAPDYVGDEVQAASNPRYFRRRPARPYRPWGHPLDEFDEDE